MSGVQTSTTAKAEQGIWTTTALFVNPDRCSYRPHLVRGGDQVWITRQDKDSGQYHAEHFASIEAALADLNARTEAIAELLRKVAEQTKAEGRAA